MNTEHREWTDGEVVTLKRMWGQQAPTGVIAQELSRSKHAIRSKAEHVGLPKRQARRAPPLELMQTRVTAHDGFCKVSIPIRTAHRLREKFGTHTVAEAIEKALES